MIDEVKAKEIGIKEYLMKPVGIDVIDNLIKKILN